MPSGTGDTQVKMAWYEHEEVHSGGLGGWDNRQKPEQKKKKMVDTNK